MTRLETERLILLISLVEPGNTASRRVAEKLGARPVRQVEHDGLTFDVYRHAPRA